MFEGNEVGCPVGYLSPETRDGEFLDGKKKLLFKRSIDILEVIKQICKKHGLRYFAAYGTLLGAIRHKGFIPWDDDMDLWMPREDFDRFQEVAARELPKRYFLQTPVTDPAYVLDVIKVRDSLSTATEQWRLDRKLRMNMGLWVSIFPLDGRYDSDFNAESPIAGKWLLTKIQDFAFRHDNKSIKYWLAHVLARILVFFIGVKRLNRWKNRINYNRPFRGSEHCASLYCLRGYTELNVRTAIFNKAMEVPFEYTTICVPEEYEEVLFNLYGDWHKLVKGSADHAYADLELDVPYKEYVSRKYGWIP